jgi:acyl-CoA thioesterase-2
MACRSGSKPSPDRPRRKPNDEVTKGSANVPDPALKILLDLLDLEEIEVNHYRGRSPSGESQRIYGGQVVAQALMAASRTVVDLTANAMHGDFLRPGDPTLPVLYEVERLRDGRSFTTRRVVAIQHGRPIFNMTASFHIDEAGLDHQTKMPAVSQPEDVPTDTDHYAPVLSRIPESNRKWYTGDRPFELRPIDPLVLFDPQPREAVQRVWLRANGTLPDDPIVHQCALAYASDLTLLDTSSMPHGKGWLTDGLFGASLDHAIWFHRSFRADDWLLYDQESPSASGARGFNLGRIYRRDGVLVASVAQEGLLRFLDDKAQTEAS